MSRVVNQTVFQPLCPDIGAPLHVSASVAVREKPKLHLQNLPETECGHPGNYLLT